jgi:hypothetical protein
MVTVTHWAGKNIKDDLGAVEHQFIASDGRTWHELDDVEKVLQYARMLQRKYDMMVTRPQNYPGLVSIYLDDLGKMFRTR